VNPMKKISGNFLSHIKMCEHLPGVDARIGSAGAGERNGLTKHCGESFFHYLLYADVFRLPLPTVILLAVICKFQKIPHECPVSGLNFINVRNLENIRIARALSADLTNIRQLYKTALF